MRTRRTRIEPLVMNVTIIQYLLLLLILPADSNVESSNMASLESGVDYSYLDTGGTSNVPGIKNGTTEVCSPWIKTAHYMPSMLQNRCNSNPNPLHFGALCGRQGRSLTLLRPPLLPGHQHRRGHGNRGIRADKNTHHQRK